MVNPGNRSRKQKMGLKKALAKSIEVKRRNRLLENASLASRLEALENSKKRVQRVVKPIIDKPVEPSPKEETIVIICEDLPLEEKSDTTNELTLNKITDVLSSSEIKQEIEHFENQKINMLNGQPLKQIGKPSLVFEIKQQFHPSEMPQARIEKQEIDMLVVPTEVEQKPSQEEHFSNSFSGRRIVEIAYLFEQIAAISDHGPMHCGWTYMEFDKEIRESLSSTLCFKCKMCGFRAKLSTIKEKKETDDRAYMGCLVSGIGWTQFGHICGALDMPCISDHLYAAAEKRVSERVSIAALKSMKEAAQEEARICRELNCVDESGTPLLTVIADGAWSKRSYKSKYDAKSGVAAIIGAHTKKILYLGVKNTYCSSCTSAKRLNKVPNPHKCYLNWSGTATAMESAIIVEGFQKSMEMHGVIYDRLIADGDSSTMKKLKIAQPYGPNRQVKKIECKNHLLRNYGYKLADLAKKRMSSSNKLVPARLRQQLKKKVMPLRSAVSSAIAFRRKEDGPISEQMEKLKEDLLNGPSHVFGEHAKCIERGYFCQHEPVQGGIVEEMRQCGLFDDIMAILNRLLKHLDSLFLALTNNICEQYNGIICKFVGGKRVNFIHSGGYERRCFAAALHFNAKGRTIYHDLQVGGLFTDKYKQLRFRFYQYPRNTNLKKTVNRKCLVADGDYGLVEDETETSTNDPVI